MCNDNNVQFFNSPCKYIQDDYNRRFKIFTLIISKGNFQNFDNVEFLFSPASWRKKFSTLEENLSIFFDESK